MIRTASQLASGRWFALTPAHALRTALVLQLASGAASLIDELLWTQQLGLALGHEYVAVLSVLAAYFVGLAIGALALARVIADSPRPALWYAGCEAAIGLWALGLSFTLPGASGWLARCLGPAPSVGLHWTVAFVGPAVLLLPATCAMGATLPAIERALADEADAARALPALYAANTAGAVLGVLLGVLALVPALGLAHTAQLSAALNLCCAALALLCFGDRRAHERRAQPAAQGAQNGAGRRLAATMFATGILSIGYEVLVVRALRQVAENTVYTFALALAVFLLALSCGSALQRSARWAAALGPAARLLALTAIACALGAATLSHGAAVRAVAAALLRPVLGDAGAAVAGEAAVSLAAFALPATAMGALFSELARDAVQRGLTLGAAVAANTFGAALAPLVFGVWLVPAIGSVAALAAVALGYLSLIGGGLPLLLRDWRIASALAIAAFVFASSAQEPRVKRPLGSELLSLREGVAATVSVLEDAAGVRTLHIDNKVQEGSSATELADARQAWLPLLLHPRPRRVLFLGLGTGVTARAALADRNLDLTAVELLPEVLEAARSFAHNESDPIGPKVVVADARRFVRAAGPDYDVIVADLFQPARSGAGALYTREHFAAVRARLAQGGLFCQWLPLHQLELDALRTIVHTFIAVYPTATALLATNGLDTPVLGLIGRAGDGRFEGPRLTARMGQAGAYAPLAALHLEDELAVLGSFVAGPRALARFAGEAPLNTDDRPRILYRAPWDTYAPRMLPRQRLLALLRELSVEPSELLALETKGGAFAPRLRAYLEARDRFIELGARVAPESTGAQLMAAVRSPLLALLHTSPDFRPAYDPLLNMAAALSRHAAPEARALLGELSSLSPSRPEAGRMLAQLAARPSSPRVVGTP